MLGRVRAPSSSPDSLQRPPNKLLKDDSFSIYEATLMKLKLGSQRSLDDPMETKINCGDVNASAIIELVHDSVVDKEAMTIDTNCSSLTSDTIGSKQQWRKNFSVIYMFSKYNNSRNGLVSSCEEIMTEAGNGIASTYSSCSECLSDDNTKERCQHESFSPTSVSHL